MRKKGRSGKGKKRKARLDSQMPPQPPMRWDGETPSDDERADPSGDPAVGDLDEHFFAVDEAAMAARSPPWVPLDEESPLFERRRTPAARARRAVLATYVKAAVGVSLAVCALAGFRWAAVHRHPAFSPSSIPVIASASLRTPDPSSSTPAGTAAPELVVTPSAPDAARVDRPEDASAATIGQEQEAPKPVKSAAREKYDARQALEAGRNAAAVAAGERSVALDPTDGETWLLLGAAYQAEGNVRDARRCFEACVKDGKRGPLAECGAMLR